MGFFTNLAEMELHKFEPKEFHENENGDLVVVLLDVEFTVKKTGKRVAEEDEIHVFRFDEEGRVIRFRHGVDTHRYELAYRKDENLKLNIDN